MLYLVGNGPSRKGVDLLELPQWWGFNMIYETYAPDMLFCCDVYPQHSAVASGYYKNNKVCVMEWNDLPIDAMYLMKMGSNIPVVEHVEEDDDFFVAQSELTTGSCDGKFYLTGYNSKYRDNLITYPHPLGKNLMGGMYALFYAVQHGHEQICLIGFDSLQFNDVSNVFQGQYNYRDTYDRDAGVGDVQKAQFIALLEYINKEYPKVEVFFKNPLGGYDIIEYNDIISRFNVEDRWILGEGLESDNKMQYNV